MRRATLVLLFAATSAQQPSPLKSVTQRSSITTAMMRTLAP